MYQKFKKSKSAKKVLRAKHAVKHKIKVSHENYLEDILGLNSESAGTQNTGKFDFFNQFFSSRSALGLVKLCQGALLSGVQSGLNLLIPASLQSKVLPMPDIDISVSGVLKRLQGLDPSKVTGPDTIKSVVLKELANDIAPIVTAIFQLSMDTDTVPPELKQALVTLF